MKIDTTKKALKSYIKKYKLEDAFPDELLFQIELHHYEKGEYVCRAGERIEHFSIQVEGRCHVQPKSEDGKIVVLSYHEPMSLNGDIELFQECPALHSVYAATPVIVIAISRKVFFNEMMQIPAFLQLLCKSYAAKLYSSSRKHSSAMLYPVKNRLGRLLLELSDQSAASGKITPDIDGISQYLGITQRHLRRVLGEYKNDGLIAHKGSSLIIKDKALLEEQSSHY
ncbi:MAG: cyclic nucleotide-binding domain-containing protein [Oscillospiraceae bacterium]|jgi:CRP-like cAMP-binding protein|nr:cyclic nucleotide-binding domain-containing protein [Oscillospiraceae bacterium]